MHVALKKVSFGTSRIQKLRRVALDENLLSTLGLEVGDLVSVALDTENEAILITRTPSPETGCVGADVHHRRSSAKG